MVACEAGHVLDADGGLGEVVAHVAAATGHVRGLGDAIEDDLLRGEACGQAGQQIPVIGEQEILAGSKGEACGELDAIVARAGRMVCLLYTSPSPRDGL